VWPRKACGPSHSGGNACVCRAGRHGTCQEKYTRASDLSYDLRRAKREEAMRVIQTEEGFYLEGVEGTANASNGWFGQDGGGAR